MKPTQSMAAAAVLVAFLGVCAGGCKSAYYGMWDKLGYEKRDLLVSEVQDAKEAQEAARQQFQTTLDRFKAITGYQGGELESKYRKLKSDYESCESRANAVRKQIKDTEEVANDMFAEWRTELAQYSNPELRRSSEEKLQQTQQKYNQVISAMKASEAKMAPVLRAFSDQVLFLKHNLNASAIASLQTTAASIEAEVGRLIADMNASINEANQFIAQMKE